MKVKDYNISLLADIYGGLLTKKQLDILRDYYDYDNSLAEIAEKYSITRQSAYDCIIAARNSLKKFEEKTGLLKRQTQVCALLGELEKSGVGESGLKIIKKIKESMQIQ